MKSIKKYLRESQEIISRLSVKDIRKSLDLLVRVRKLGGRIFCLGVGGSAANASHAVNDFRKLCGIEAYAPTDNAAELTARINDQGWEHSYRDWLEASRLKKSDLILVFSVGGGDDEKKISVNLVESLKYAQKIGSKIVGVVSDRGGYTGRVADACVRISASGSSSVTAHTEALQALMLHLWVSHPKLQMKTMTWESILAPKRKKLRSR